MYKPYNVVEAAKKRITALYQEDREIVIGFSGGKDSTIVLELTVQIATTLKRLPVKVYFLDQEYQATIDYMQRIQKRPEITLSWFQIPFKLTNSTSRKEIFLDVWDVDKRSCWMRKKERQSIKKIGFKENRFFKVIEKLSGELCNGKYVTLCGLRAQESQRRLMNMCKQPINGRSWWSRTKDRPDCFRAYPIYDWKTSDVWKYIGENRLDYNKIYDKFFRLGLAAHNARVSSIIHETGVNELQILQEAEPETYHKLVQRIPGITTYGKTYANLYKVNHNVMGVKFFKTKKEYIFYLIELLCKPEYKEKFYNYFDKLVLVCKKNNISVEKKYNAFISSILLNDFEEEKLKNVLSGCTYFYKES